MKSNNIVKMEGIYKSFSNSCVINNCKFELMKGEVHALIGENGAGKSTLMKILAGIYSKDSGSIVYQNEEVEFRNPRAAQSSGIAMIHQELSLIPNLTVAQNIFIGREQSKRAKFIINEKKIISETEKILSLFDIDIYPTEKVSDLTIAKQQIVEIGKALSLNAKVLIMDEPTATLTDSEIDKLFNIIRDIKNVGVSVVYISHRLEELKIISDRVTILRDGNYIDTVDINEIEIDKMIKMIAGRVIYHESKKTRKENGQEIVLETKNLSKNNVFENINFRLGKGEILGFSGLVGAGRTEVARAVFGADRLDSGDIYIHGRKVNIASPRDAVKHGIGYISEDRHQFGLVLDNDAEFNVVLGSLNKFTRFLGWVNKSEARNTAKRFVDALEIKMSSLEQKVKNLSGGNQQKLVVSKWLIMNMDILIFDEPTRGIDIGAKNEIYKLMNELVEKGKSIIMISSELPEILRMSHRIVVMCEGRITGELNGDEATQERIIEYAMKTN